MGLPRSKEVPRDWTKLHKEFHNLHSLPNTAGVIKSRTMRWAGHVALT
jgi:hypothetical protein